MEFRSISKYVLKNQTKLSFQLNFFIDYHDWNMNDF
jgi:hypothetical protein